MVNIAVADKKRHNEYLMEVFKIYESVSVFQTFPKIHMIYGQYCAMVDGRVMTLKAELYSDDFYDGTPGTSPKKHILPDSIVNNLRDYIYTPEDITEQIIQEILTDHQMFYVDKGVFNSPIQGVW